jgi:hypothetical protein
MSEAKNVLLVTNGATEEEINLIKQAIQQQHDMAINVVLVHVIPSLPTCYFNIPSTVLLAERYYDEAEKCLTTIGQKLGVEKKHQWLINGRVKTEVLRLANKLKAQFILASSTTLAELHSALLAKRHPSASVQGISNLVSL